VTDPAPRPGAAPAGAAGRGAPGSIALIGNGPIARAEAATIDRFDRVVRINHARLCGAAGTRTDALVLPFVGAMAHGLLHKRPVNQCALRGAKEIWFRDSPPENDAGLGGEMLRLVVRGRPHLFFPEGTLSAVQRELLAFAGDRDPGYPSAGAQTLWYLLSTFPDSPIRLFGFTHRGWSGHSWDAEAEWMNRLVASGRLSRASLSGRECRERLDERIVAELVRTWRGIRDRLRGEGAAPP
jgi:hypothetical protein